MELNGGKKHHTANIQFIKYYGPGHVDVKQIVINAVVIAHIAVCNAVQNKEQEYQAKSQKCFAMCLLFFLLFEIANMSV